MVVCACSDWDPPFVSQWQSALHWGEFLNPFMHLLRRICFTVMLKRFHTVTGGAQVLVTAAPGTLVGCIDYLVSGSYAVSDRQMDGSYTMTTGSSDTPVLVSTGCSAPPAPTVRVELFTDYASYFSGTAYVAGYTAHYTADPQSAITDARIVVSGPDGGVCAHEPPLFRLPLNPSAQPSIDTAAGTLTFSSAAATPQLIEAARPFRLRAARSGGFAAVMALSIASDPVSSGQRQHLWSMTGSVATLGLEVAVTGRLVATLAYVGNATQFQVTAGTVVQIGTVFVVALVYDHSSLSFELYVDGVAVSADTSASDAVRLSTNDHDLCGILVWHACVILWRVSMLEHWWRPLHTGTSSCYACEPIALSGQVDATG